MRFALAHLLDLTPRSGRRGLGLLQLGFGQAERVAQRRQHGFAFARIEHGGVAFQLVPLRDDAGMPGASLVRAPLQRLPAGDEIGQRSLRLGMGRFTARQSRFRRRKGGACVRDGGRISGLSLQQGFVFRGQAGQAVGGIAADRLLSGEIGAEFGEALGQLLGTAPGPAVLGLDLVESAFQAHQRCCGRGLGLAQGRNAVCGDSLDLCSFGLGQGALVDHAGRGRELVSGEAGLGLRFSVADQGELRLGAADVAGEAAIAGGLPRLPLQPLHLRGNLAEHVFEPDEIVLRRLQPELRLVAPAVQTGDAGGIFEDAAARLRFRGDQFADLTLAHQGGRARAGRGIGEKQLHVAGAHLLAVDTVGRALLALDPAGDFENVAVVEGGRGAALAVVERQSHLGHVASRALARSAEDDVVHPRAAHVLERAFAHHPAQRFDEVGLAAAIGANDAGQPRLDQKIPSARRRS